MAPDARFAALFKERFECTEETEKAYRSYAAAAVGASSGTIEQQFKHHLKQLYAAYGSMHRAGAESVHDKGCPRRITDPGDTLTKRLNARLNAASDWYPTRLARLASGSSCSSSQLRAMCMRQRPTYCIGGMPTSSVKRGECRA